MASTIVYVLLSYVSVYTFNRMHSIFHKTKYIKYVKLELTRYTTKIGLHCYFDKIQIRFVIKNKKLVIAMLLSVLTH